MLRKSVLCLYAFFSVNFLHGTDSYHLGIAQASAQTQSTQLKQQVSAFFDKGSYSQALPLAQKYIQVAKQEYGEAHAEYGAALSLLGRIHFSNGSYTQATPFLENALKIREKALGANNREVAKDLEYLAELYYALVMFDKADALIARAKKIAQK